MLGHPAVTSGEAALGKAEEQAEYQEAGGFLGLVSLGFVDHGGPEGKRASPESLG